MNSIVLPPSPNWYLSNILTYSKRKTLVWGAKNGIVIAKQKENDPALEFFTIQDAHVDRVTALAFCPQFEPDGSELIISCGDDDKAKIWNIDKLELVIVFSFGDDKPIVGVDWSVKNNNLACAVNSQGYLLSCNIQYQTVKKIPLGKLTATCLACCPHEAGLVAVGSKCGLIYIIDLDKNGLILYKMRGHDEEIVSLSWCPSDVNVLSTDHSRDLLLASGSKDKSVFIWRAGRDGRCESTINLPKLPVVSQSLGSQPHKSKLAATVGTWTTVCWVEPNVLLTSSVWGELLSWNLSMNNGGKIKQYELLHTYHNRGLFCIATAPKYNEVSDNWRENSELTIWTLAQDRWIICCSKRGNKSVELKYNIPTQGGYIYCLAACPVDTSRIAFGVGDMMLRLWNLSEPHVTTFDVTMFWQKIKGKLRVVAWQPENERLLAFGTSEGRIGLIDVMKNVPILFKQYHRKIIYKLEWGPVPNKGDLGVFSCSEGELVAYDVKNPDKVPMSIIKEECTEFSWNPDNLMLAIALENGRVLFYNQYFEKCGNMIYLPKKTVNCLVWHPESTAVDTWSSPMKDHLAIASDSPTILIYDISDLRKELETREEIIEPTRNGNDQQRNMNKLVATLNGHCDKVVCLAWSPHVTGYLVSGSYDYTAQVWNVEKEQLMGTYMGHSGPVLCCMWSPLKPQLIITGSSDFTLSIWDYTSPEQSPKTLSEDKKKRLKNKAQKYKIQDKTANLGEHNKSVTNNSTSSTNHSPVTTTEIVETKSPPELLKDVGKKKEKKPSYFPIYNKTMNMKHAMLNYIRNDVRKNREQNTKLENGVNDHDNATLSLFSGKEDLQAIIAKEKLGHAARHKNDTVTEMEMWCDGLRQDIECAIKEKRLNDFLVSLSTSLSVKTWKETCEAYAHQLIMEGNVEKAVSYLLCIHKIYEAVKAYLDVRMYREAYVLAKFKLADDDPTVAIVLQSWAHYATITGQLELAAQCYVKLGELTKAAKLLSRRNDPDCLEVASQLALICGDVEFSLSLAEDAMMHALVKLNYSKARSLVENIQGFQHLKIYIDAYEAITNICDKETLCDTMRKWIEGKSDHGMLQDLKKRHDASYYDALQRSNVLLARTVTDNQATMQLLHASYQIALAAMSDLKETQLKHIATALGKVYQHKTEGLFTYILVTLDMRKPTDEDSIYAKSNCPISISVRAYLCIGLINWLMSDLENLSIEEEIQLMKLVHTLLEDAFEKETEDHVQRACKIKQLGDRVADFLLKVDDTTDTREDELYKLYKSLKLEERNFMEKRVSVPNPQIIRKRILELHKMLRDDTYQTQALPTSCNIEANTDDEVKTEEETILDAYFSL